MPSKPSFWPKSNRSQTSVGSTTDFASSASPDHRYRLPDDSQQRPYHSPPPPGRRPSNLSLEHPPINVAAAVSANELPATPIDSPAPPSYASYSPHPDKSVNNGHEKKSLRSRLGLGSSSKDGAEQQSKISRRASTRRKEVPPSHRPQSIVDDQRHWQGKHLAPSHEADESESHLDPFLQVQPDQRSPVPPAKDPYFDANNPAIGQGPDPNEYRRPSLARVNTEQSFQQSLRGQNSGEYHNSPHPPGNGGLSAHNPPPQHYHYHAQQPQVQTDQNQEYQAFNPHSADSAGSQTQQQLQELDSQQTYIKQQADFQAYQRLQQQEQQHQQAQQGRPGSRQQQEQDLQFIAPPEQPLPQQHQSQQPDAYRGPIPRVAVQTQPRRPSQQEPHPIQQQFIPPSPVPSHQSQNLAPQTTQEFVVTPVQESQHQQTTEQMPPSGQNKRASEVPKGSMGPPSRENSNLAQQSSNRQAFPADVVPSGSQDQRFRGSKNGNDRDNESGRGTPPPKRAVSDMSDEDVAQLMKEHDVLREKYQKVKRYFFEQQSQVHSLQNTLAHQRLSQSRTSLDDTEYSARFERLHGLVKQAAFAIRKIWKEIPQWLQTAVNADAAKIGQREMTAVGRAVISKWLLDEIFNKFFHPDLDQHLSRQLKNCHINIRKNAPLAANTEEEEALTAKLINWRLATTEGFADQLRGPQALTNRELLITSLNESLTATMELYVVDPNHEDFKELKANVPPIIELAVNILSHLPMESREIAIEHYPPGHGIMGEQMTVESGIPALVTPCAEGILQHRDGDAAERASLTSTASDMKDAASAGLGGDEADSQQSSPQSQQQEPKRNRGMLANLMGGGGKKLQQSEARQREREQQLGAARAGDNGGSQVSLQSGPPKEEQPPRVRIATGMSVRIYGKGVLWKATVFPTA